jgi:hypothetical protein
MPTSNVEIEEFREFVARDYGPEIAGEFVRELGAAGFSTPYGHAMKALETVLSRHTAPSRSWRTTTRADINLVI